jgi:hypothetical protein
VVANSGNGDAVALFYTLVNTSFIFVPQGYASGSPLSDSATYNNQTFASLGVTPGTYEWTWGTGPNQNFTLEIGAVSPVPEPPIGPVLLAAGGLLAFGAKRRGH